MEAEQKNPVPSIKVDVAEEDIQDSLSLPSVAEKARHFSGSSDTSNTSTGSRKMMTVEAARATLESKIEMLECDLAELENSIEGESPNRKKVEHNLQWAKSQVDIAQKVRQGLITLLLKEKNMNEFKAEEIQHRELARRFMKLEHQANELLQSLSSPQKGDDKDEAGDPVQLQILEDIGKLLNEEICELKEAVEDEDGDILPELLVKVEVTFGKYQSF